MPIYVPGKLTLRKTWQPMDPDAAAYIAAVETADGQSLEEATKRAIDNFVLGCKEDGIWSAIKASCILAGARTLAGCLVPLAGTAPTNFNFVAGDYNRKTGLKGDGSTKYLNSNRAANADPQNSFHASAYVSSVQINPVGKAILGAINTTPSVNRFLQLAVDDQQDIAANRSLNSLPSNRAAGSLATGLQGTSRGTNSLFSFLISKQQLTTTASSITPGGSNIYVFAQNLNNGTLSAPTDARLSFYSIGESLDLAKLDGRVTDLMNAFAAAIP